MQDIIKNTKKIMKKRGYKVKEQEKLEKNKIHLICEKETEKGSETAQVLIIGEVETLGVAMIRDIVKDMNKKKIKNKLIVGSGKVTRSAKNEMIANKIDFIPSELVLMNILDHEWVPTHEIISSEEAKEIMDKYRITEELLPEILDTDPVAKIIGAKPGDFIKITRKSPTAGETIVYRLCVKGEE